MNARNHREWTPDLASSNGLLNGNILLSTSSLSEPSAQITSVQAQNMGGGAQQLDQLESQLKALHQQALSTQTTLQQLKTQDVNSFPLNLLSDASWVLGAEGFVLGLGALVLGGVLGWYSWRRPVAESAMVEADFADSRIYLNEKDPAPQPDVFKTPEVQGTASTPAHAFTRNFPEEVDFAQSAPMAESESVLNLFWADAPPSPPEPVEDMLEPMRSADPSPFAPPAPSLEFDPEVAASEVERVRKSLADKRDARARQRMNDDWTRDSMHLSLASADMSEQGAEPARAELLEAQEAVPLGAEVDLALDLDLDLDLDFGADSEVEPEPVSDLIAQAMKDLGNHSLEPPEEVLPHSDAPVPELTMDSPADGSEPAQEDPRNDAPMVEFEFVPQAETQDTVPNLAQVEPVQAVDVDVDMVVDVDADVEAHVGPDPAVQLELAQEFLALDLLQGARELALEVLQGGDANLQSQAQALIDQLNTLETAQRVGALVDTPAAL